MRIKEGENEAEERERGKTGVYCILSEFRNKAREIEESFDQRGKTSARGVSMTENFGGGKHGE